MWRFLKINLNCAKNCAVGQNYICQKKTKCHDFFKLKSDNKNFLDILHKNPNTDQGLYLKELKNGIVIGKRNFAEKRISLCLFKNGKKTVTCPERRKSN
ncbi:hypothetical protein ACFFWB_26730 [Flavobacterium procerum]|uniref:hypothetical protein n=1 Tax=Flavobacterium procerum TaxID=1455569 RepID=UPI0035EEE353